MSTNVVATNPATPLAANASPLSYIATFTPDTVAGAASADQTIGVSDENIPGAAARPSLAVTTTGRTFTAATFPVTGFLNLLSGETLGTGPFSIQPNVTLTKSGPGTMNVNDVQSNGGNSALVVSGGVVNISTDAGAAGNAPLSLTASIAGVVNFSAPQHLHSLSTTGGSVSVAAGGSNLIVTDNIAASGGGAIDLQDNSMIVHSPTGAWSDGSYSGVTGLVASGRNGGNWDGGGIVTSQSLAHGANALTTLAVASASDALGIASSATTTWGGETVSGSDTLVKYTYAGDANLSGWIDADDYFAIDTGYARDSNPSYASGDFNYDGQINGDDYFLIDSNYVGQTMAFSAPVFSGSVEAVPEPVSGMIFVIAASVFSRRTRVRS